jgi:hypothetical protein
MLVTPTPRAIALELTHPEFEPGKIRGFRFFWAFYVSGFRSDVHCQQCFKGDLVKHFCTPTARSGQKVVFDQMDRYPYVYVCGVGSGPKTELAGQNFHWALRYEADSLIEAHTYNGYRATALNAVALPIPELPLGWNGRDRETTRCKNFRFGVEYFGYPSR